MDGLLIDSEPLWQEAEIEVFADIGVEMTRAMCKQMMGLRIDEVVAHWNRVFRWGSPGEDEVVTRIVRRVVELIEDRSELRPGVHEVIDFVTARVERTAVASASTRAIIDAVMGRFDLARHFDLIYSADQEPFGKPHPGIYLTVASTLGARPERCLALEDSINGVIAAKAARMRCVAVPEPGEREPFAVADLVLDRLVELPGRWSELVG